MLCGVLPTFCPCLITPYCCCCVQVQVAVKCLSKDKMQSGMSDFLKEATIMHSMDNEHVVRMYGVVLGTQNLMLVSAI